MTTLELASDHTSSASPSLLDKVLKVGGIGGLIALIVVIWLTQSMSATQRNTLDAVREHATDSHADQKVQRQLLYAICLNSAKSPDARTLCEVGR